MRDVWIRKGVVMSITNVPLSPSIWRQLRDQRSQENPGKQRGIRDGTYDEEGLDFRGSNLDWIGSHLRRLSDYDFRTDIRGRGCCIEGAM